MYEWQYDEGVPLIEVEIINPYTNMRTKKLGLIDSGSDWSSIPKELWDELQFRQIGVFDLGTPYGWLKSGYSWCNMIIANKMIPVELHYTDDYEILIGRNAMKYFVITFDGIASKITINNKNR